MTGSGPLASAQAARSFSLPEMLAAKQAVSSISSKVVCSSSCCSVGSASQAASEIPSLSSASPKSAVTT